MESLYVLNDCYEAAPAAPQRPAYISPEDGSVYVYPQWAYDATCTAGFSRATAIHGASETAAAWDYNGTGGFSLSPQDVEQQCKWPDLRACVEVHGLHKTGWARGYPFPDGQAQHRGHHGGEARAGSDEGFAVCHPRYSGAAEVNEYQHGDHSRSMQQQYGGETEGLYSHQEQQSFRSSSAHAYLNTYPRDTGGARTQQLFQLQEQHSEMAQHVGVMERWSGRIDEAAGQSSFSQYEYHPRSAGDICTGTAADGGAGALGSVVAGGAACTSRERSEADHLQDPEKDAAQAKVELQRVKKRESARRRYHLRQQQLLELQATVKESRQNNLELQRDLDKLLSEADDLGKREKELVDAQKLSRDEIQKLKQQKLALKGK